MKREIGYYGSVHMSIRAPSDKWQEALKLRMQGMTYKQIAAKLGWKDLGRVSYMIKRTRLWNEGVRRETHGFYTDGTTFGDCK